MSGKPKVIITKEELEELYVKQEMSTIKIGEKFGIGAESVRRRLNNNGIKRRTTYFTADINKEELIDLYVNKNLSADKIGKIFNVNGETIRRKIKKLNISNIKNQITKEILIELYVKKQFTIKEISEKFGVNRHVIMRKILKFDIEKTFDFEIIKIDKKSPTKPILLKKRILIEKIIFVRKKNNLNIKKLQIHNIIEKEKLKELYLIEKKYIDEVAIVLNTNIDVVKYYLNLYRINFIEREKEMCNLCKCNSTVNSNYYCRKCYLKLKRYQIKIALVELKGGKCETCNSGIKEVKTYGAFEFHHIDPTKKDFVLSNRSLSKNIHDLIPELNKCKLLCSNCHKLEHSNLEYQNLVIEQTKKYTFVIDSMRKILDENKKTST